MRVAEWSGEVRSISYSADGKTVSVVYRVTLYGTDAEVVLPLPETFHMNGNKPMTFASCYMLCAIIL